MKKNLLSKKLQWVLSVFIFVVIGSLAGVFLFYRHISKKPERLVSALAGKAEVSISKVHHIATKDGKKQWSLDAATAVMLSGRKEAVLKDVRVTFYLKDDTEMHLTADRGVLDYPSNDIRVEGHVVVRRGPFEARTERLDYYHSRQAVISSVPVEIFGTGIRVTADSMQLDLNTSTTVFERNVRGILHEGVSL